ncbi:hypothetical protein MA16_Dca000904 [Dendrobium catenatum]|uniref:Uncharacterized protein n=1 Tax=Dendrobium catenatum TaxID=906689 RepID=A0A2I0WV67_9ASPA|nr:hypothetical protein MA16_Dca000904 [Dendrobium catenatum]
MLERKESKSYKWAFFRKKERLTYRFPSSATWSGCSISGIVPRIFLFTLTDGEFESWPVAV